MLQLFNWGINLLLINKNKPDNKFNNKTRDVFNEKGDWL